MKKQRMSDTWEQLVGLDADQAEAQGWFIRPRWYSPQEGWAVDLINPKGELVAWGHRPFVGNVRDVIQQAQVAYQKRVGGA